MPHRALCGPTVAHFGSLCFAFSGFFGGRITYPLGLKRDRLWHIYAHFGMLCFAFSGFEDAASAPSLRTNYLPLGLESCWSFPVSHACRTELFADRLWHILARFCFAFGGFEDAASAPMPLGSRAPGRFSFHVARASLHDPFGFWTRFPIKSLVFALYSESFFCFFVIFLSCFRFRWNLGSAAWAVALLYNLYILYMYIVVPACCAFSAHFSPIACITNLVLVKLQHFKSCYVLQRRKHICKILRRMALDCGNVLGR